jgi:hypothetical protein
MRPIFGRGFEDTVRLTQGGSCVQIILISDRLAKARSVNLSLAHLAGAGLLALALLCGSTIALYWFTLRYAA